MKSTARQRAAITIVLTMIAVIMTVPTRASSRQSCYFSVYSPSVLDDYNVAWQRLVTYVNGLQAIDGQVSSTDLASVTASLNSALDHLDQAKNALDKGQSAQASANITQANAIMDAVDPAYKALQAQARQTRMTNIETWIGGIAVACVVVIILLYFKRRRDKKKLREFLDAKIDYTGVETKPDSE